MPRSTSTVGWTCLQIPHVYFVNTALQPVVLLEVTASAGNFALRNRHEWFAMPGRSRSARPQCTFIRTTHEDCPESIQPFWISPQPVEWPWCNLAASRRRPYCASVNSQLSRGASQSAVRRRWLSLCTVWPSHSQWPSEQISKSASMRLPILQFTRKLYGKTLHHPGLSAPLRPRFGSLRLLVFPKAKIAV